MDQCEASCHLQERTELAPAVGCPHGGMGTSSVGSEREPDSSPVVQKSLLELQGPLTQNMGLLEAGPPFPFSYVELISRPF